MVKRVQIVGHTQPTADTFIGFDREITVDQTDKTVNVHDGINAGGSALATADLLNVAAATPSVAGKMAAADKTKLDGIETAAKDDQTASEVVFTPAGDLVATDVQAALVELEVDYEAADAAHAALTNNPHSVTKAQVSLGSVIDALQVAATDIVSQADAEAGTSTTARIWNALRVKQAIQALAPSPIEAGTIMCFFQAAAPTGWTQDATHNDKVLRVVNGAGGGDAGSWTITGVTVDSHVLTVAEMPAHAHQSGGSVSIAGSDATPTNVRRPDTAAPDGEIVGGGGGHVHGLTSDGVWRPAYIDVIIAAKD